MFPDMYVYRDPSATTHPFKFGHDYYMCERGDSMISRQTLIIQGVLLVFVFLFYGDMTKMNVGAVVFGFTQYAFSKTATSGTIQSGTVGWMCAIVIDIVLERIFFVKVGCGESLFPSECWL